MPAISPSSPAEQAKREYIRQTVRRAAEEEWSLETLATNLGVSERMARYYIERENFELTRVIRPARVGAQRA
jgi:AraC-like DNA-binding protein